MSNNCFQNPKDKLKRTHFKSVRPINSEDDIVKNKLKTVKTTETILGIKDDKLWIKNYKERNRCVVGLTGL